MATNIKDKNITLKSRYLAVNFIGLAMIAAIFVYAGLVEVIKWHWAPFHGFAKLPVQTESLLRYIFLGLAGVQYLVIKAVPKLVRVETPEHLAQAAIITFALCESVALLGLVLFLLCGTPLNFYLFMVISLGFFYLFYPKYEEWEQKMEPPRP